MGESLHEMIEGFHYDLMEACMEWCSAEDEVSCKAILDKLKEKCIFVGDFVEALDGKLCVDRILSTSL